MDEPKQTRACRKKGAGTLQLRGTKYLAIWTVNGNRYTRSTGTSDLAEAEKKLAEFVKPFQERTELEIIENLQAKIRVKETQIKDTRNRELPPLKLMFMVDKYKEDLSTGNITDSTENSYQNLVNVFIRETELEFAYQVDEEVAKKFLEGIKRRCKINTYNQYVGGMRMLFNIAMKIDYRVRSNPFDGFKKLKDTKGQRKELTFEEVSKLFESAARISVDYEELCKVAAYEGMRKSDACTFTWDEVDWKNNLIRYLPEKTKANGIYAVVPIHPEVLEILKRHKELNGEDKYVLPKMAKAYKTQHINYYLTRIFDDAGVERHHFDKDGKKKVDTAFHAFRVFFASCCARSGIPVNQIMKMLAHTKAEMSLHYVLTQDVDLKLPDFDDTKVKVILKKDTMELIEKSRGVMDIDEFITCLIRNGNANIASVQKMKESEELDKLVDEVMGM